MQGERFLSIRGPFSCFQFMQEYPETELKILSIVTFLFFAIK